MIIVRSPLRITLGGGGTDLPSYYREQGGFLIAAAIDKYVYITVHQTFIDDLIVKYSELERVGSAHHSEDRGDEPLVVRRCRDKAGRPIRHKSVGAENSVIRDGFMCTSLRASLDIPKGKQLQ